MFFSGLFPAVVLLIEIASLVCFAWSICSIYLHLSLSIFQSLRVAWITIKMTCQQTSKQASRPSRQISKPASKQIRQPENKQTSKLSTCLICRLLKSPLYLDKSPGEGIGLLFWFTASNAEKHLVDGLAQLFRFGLSLALRAGDRSTSSGGSGSSFSAAVKGYCDCDCYCYCSCGCGCSFCFRLLL